MTCATSAMGLEPSTLKAHTLQAQSSEESYKLVHMDRLNGLNGSITLCCGHMF